VKAKAHHLWLGLLEAHEHLVVQGWRMTIAELPSAAATTMAGALTRMGVPCAVDRDRAVVAGKLDDVRRRCHVCEDGCGAHVCDGCQSAVLTQRLELSVGGAR